MFILFPTSGIVQSDAPFQVGFLVRDQHAVSYNFIFNSCLRIAQEALSHSGSETKKLEKTLSAELKNMRDLSGLSGMSPLTTWLDHTSADARRYGLSSDLELQTLKVYLRRSGNFIVRAVSFKWHRPDNLFLVSHDLLDSIYGS